MSHCETHQKQFTGLTHTPLPAVSISSLLEKKPPPHDHHQPASSRNQNDDDVIVIDDSTDIEEDSQDTGAAAAKAPALETHVEKKEEEAAAASASIPEKDLVKPTPKRGRPRKKEETAAVKKVVPKRVYKTKAMKAAELAASIRAAAAEAEMGEQASNDPESEKDPALAKAGSLPADVKTTTSPSITNQPTEVKQVEKPAAAAAAKSKTNAELKKSSSSAAVEKSTSAKSKAAAASKKATASAVSEPPISTTKPAVSAVSAAQTAPAVPKTAAATTKRPPAKKPTDIANLMNDDSDIITNTANQMHQLLPSILSKDGKPSPVEEQHGISMDPAKMKGMTFSEITGLPELPPLSKELYGPLQPSPQLSAAAKSKPITPSKTTMTKANEPKEPKEPKDTKETKEPKEPKQTKPKEPKEPKPKAQKAASKKAAAVKPEETPKPPQLTPDQLQNQALKQPKPNASLPTPKLLEVSKSPNESSKEDTTTANNIEPIIVIDVPLSTPTQEPGSAQVVFNVLKMAEDKYGWKNIHPNASKFSNDLMNDDDIDDDDLMEDEDDEPEEPKEPTQPTNPQKGKPKIGQYDVEDPFIDDTELVWEEQRASTKDGFFVFYGPLVEEGKNARIEKLDGTIKRGRKRPGPLTGAAGSRKKANNNSRQTTPRPLIAIAPLPNSTNSTATPAAAAASNTASNTANNTAAPAISTTSSSAGRAAPAAIAPAPPPSSTVTAQK
jgi:hypothetical protein